MSSSLVKAVMARADLTAAALSGTAHLMEAAGAALPYMTVVPLDGSPQDFATDKSFTDVRPVLFNWYTTTAALAWAAVHAIEAAFTASPLALDSGDCFGAFPGASNAELDPDRETDGKEVWHGLLVMEFSVRRSPGS